MLDTSPKQKYGYNALPRLSANQISEYLIATPTRRKSIVQAAKFPKTAIVARYDAARESITKYLCDLARDQQILISAIDSQTTRGGKLLHLPLNSWRRRQCISLVLFIHRAEQFDIQKCSDARNSLTARTI
jgi:hypothetical protein